MFVPVLHISGWDRHGHTARKLRERGGYIPQFTEEQIQAAKSVDLLTYIQTREPGNLEKVGAGVYHLKDHDSVKISNGKWFRHSRGYGGHTAYQFLTKVRGMDFQDAIQTLLDERLVYVPHAVQHEKPPALKAPLVLPPPNRNNDQVYAYLQSRGIDKAVIRRCIENGSLYESEKTHRQEDNHATRYDG